MKKLLLGSGSPRRKELLEGLGYQFEVVKIDCDETFPADMDVTEIAGYLSVEKANAFRILKEEEVLLTADTIVVLHNEVLGKPKSEEEAKMMLRKLSGKTHQVYTGFSIKTKTAIITNTDVANVSFQDIDNEEIDFYIKSFQPFDKAGSYGIQEWLGMAKIKSIQGSFYTIMGLPTHLVYEKLKLII